MKTGEKSWHFPGYVQDALSQEEFEQLYDVCGEILHMRNPFSTKDPTTNIGYSVDEWVARIERLLAWHSVQLLDGQRWLCQIPAEGPVHVTTGTPLPAENSGRPSPRTRLAGFCQPGTPRTCDTSPWPPLRRPMHS